MLDQRARASRVVPAGLDCEQSAATVCQVFGIALRLAVTRQRRHWFEVCELTRGEAAILKMP